MASNLENLIQQTRVLSEEKKKQYMTCLPLLPSDACAELEIILTAEQEGRKQLEQNHKQQQEDLDQKFSQELEIAFKEQMRQQSEIQEAKEKEQSEDILKKLDTV